MFEHGSKGARGALERGTAHRSSNDAAVQRKGQQRFDEDERSALRKEAEGQAPAGQEPTGAQQKPAAQAIVEDGAPLAPGQVHRSTFMAQARSGVTSVCNEELAAVGRSAEGCPFIQHYLDVYDGKSAPALARAVQLYAGAAPQADASALLRAVLARVRGSVRAWAGNGDAAGMPSGVPADDGAAPPAAPSEPAAGGALAKREDGGGGSRARGAADLSQSSGASLDGGVRHRMESAFGQSFADVRVHTDGAAASRSDALAARAFTVGADIAFGRGEYRPGTTEGDLLIAHELAHVAQQRGGMVSAARTDDRGLEQQADVAAAAALGLVPRDQLGVLGGSPLSLQRCGKKKDERRKTAKSVQPLSRIGTEAFNRDPAGKIVVRNDGSETWVMHGGDPSVEFKVQPVELQLKDGSWIKGDRGLGVARPVGGSTESPDHRLDADCHGVSFTQGEYWINDDQVEALLKGGGLKETATPKVGDVAVYRDSSGLVVHSTTVTRVDPATGAVLEVSGLGGIQMDEHRDAPVDAWGDPTVSIKYYTR